jgi:hypothetical protein
MALKNRKISIKRNTCDKVLNYISGAETQVDKVREVLKKVQ